MSKSASEVKEIKAPAISGATEAGGDTEWFLLGQCSSISTVVGRAILLKWREAPPNLDGGSFFAQIPSPPSKKNFSHNLSTADDLDIV